MPSLDDAIAHITRFGSGHSEAIVTRDLAAAQRFTQEVDAAAVVVNASTRFVDGEEFGFGAEIGISHPEAARPRSDGSARAHDAEVRRGGHGADPRVAGGDGRPGLRLVRRDLVSQVHGQPACQEDAVSPCAGTSS